jgi:hypothetical protein
LRFFSDEPRHCQTKMPIKTRATSEKKIVDTRRNRHLRFNLVMRTNKPARIAEGAKKRERFCMVDRKKKGEKKKKKARKKTQGEEADENRSSTRRRNTGLFTFVAAHKHDIGRAIGLIFSGSIGITIGFIIADAEAVVFGIGMGHTNSACRTIRIFRTPF